MAAFVCKHCDFDLTLRVDLIARAMKAEYKTGEFPTDISVDGCCDRCQEPFHFGGEMFTHFLTTKAEEDMIDPRASDFLIIEFDASTEEMDEVRRALSQRDTNALQALMIRLLADGKRPDKK